LEAHNRVHNSHITYNYELESGGIFKRFLKITNFVEVPYFSWYLDELDEEIADALCGVAKRLADYEPATSILEPECVRDMLKKLYQNLVPRKIRHDLGEYYTPDWLAELVLDEVGLTVEKFEELAGYGLAAGTSETNMNKRVDPAAPFRLGILDPACGSGTFLILAIKRLKEYAEEHHSKDLLAFYLLENVVGFDPLAVLTARTNYLLAIADLLSYINGPVEIPVYLADSLLTESRSTLTEVAYEITHYVGKFELPKSIVDKGLLNGLLDAVDKFVRQRYSTDEFKQAVLKDFRLDKNELKLLASLYAKFLKLEQEGKNHVWTTIIKNAFAPLTTISSRGKFDFVIGNPPWINWENLPEDYRNREEIKNIWSHYGLLEQVKGIGLGKVKRDIAMLFLARCLNKYVKNGGKLAFLITFTVFKTQAGAGFRKFLAKGCRRSDEDDTPCKVLRVHDLTSLSPFEGAANQTSLVVIEKAAQTNFPVPCVIWSKTERVRRDAGIEDVRKATKQLNLTLIPVDRNKPESPWMQITEKAYAGIKKILGSSPWYKAYAGVYTGLNQVYWVKVISETPDGLLITNPPLPGQKKEVRQVKQVVEKELVYPLVRGRDVKKWYCSGEIGYILLPVDKNGDTLPHSDLKVRFPKTWEYFNNFTEDLVNRGGEPYQTKLEPYRKKEIRIAEKLAPPFYWLFNVKPALALNKVVWKYISGNILGKAELSTAVIGALIPNEKLMLIPLSSEDEAYYVSGVLNSSIVQFFVVSCVIATAISTHITERIRIPKFDPKNPEHLKLSTLSRKRTK
jgi:type II restriction/modification system DNA methylase subunit YeeA